MLKLAFTFLLATVVISEETAASCLEKANLEKLKTTAKDAIEKLTAPSYCTSVFKDPGTCVDEATVETAINYFQDKFTEYNAGYKKLVDMFDTFFGNIGSSLSELWDKITDKESEKTWKDKMAEEVKKAQDAHDKCFMSYNKISHGTICVLASGVAGQKATVDGNKIKLKATNSALQVVSDCLGVIAANCLFFKGGKEAELDTAQTDNQKSLCDKFSEYEKCISDGGNDTTCLDEDKKQKFFKHLYSLNTNSWMPDVTKVDSITDKMLEWFSNTKDKVFSWFKSTDEANTTTSRILAEELTIEIEIDSTGADLWTIGGESGVTIKGIRIHQWLSLTIIMGLFIKLI